MTRDKLFFTEQLMFHWTTSAQAKSQISHIWNIYNKACETTWYVPCSQQAEFYKPCLNLKVSSSGYKKTTRVGILSHEVGVLNRHVE